MSLLSSERLLVAIHERGIDVLQVRRARFSRSPVEIVGRQRVDIDPSPPGCGSADVTLDGGGPALPWQRPVALLRELAGSGAPKVQLIVANRFVRYQLLPWDNIVACRGDTQALAQAHFELSFGTAAAGWTVIADAPRFRCASLAAAIDSQLLAVAGDLVAAAGLQVTSVRPYLLSALSFWSRRLKRPARPVAGWFAVFEPGRLTVLGTTPDGPVSLHSVRLHAPDALLPTLAQCVAADQINSALDGCVYLHAPGWFGDCAGRPSLVRLDGQGNDDEATDFGRAMAWCGSL